MRALVSLAFLACVAVAINDSPLPCLPPSFRQFTATSSVTVEGTATLVGNTYQLTANAPNQLGAVWYQSPINLGAGTGFKTYVQMQIQNPSSTNSEGICFLMQLTMNLGPGGQAFGMNDTSVAICLDTDENDPTTYGPNDKLVVYQSNSTNRLASYDIGAAGFAASTYWSMWIQYTIATQLLEVFLVPDSTVLPTLPTLSTNVDLFGYFGSTIFDFGIVGATDTTGETNILNQWHCDNAIVFNDPHFFGFDGSKFDFIGTPGHVYAIYADTNLQINAQLEQLTVGSVNGTWMGEIGIRNRDVTMLISSRFGVMMNDVLVVSSDQVGSTEVVVKTDRVVVTTPEAEISVSVHRAGNNAFLNMSMNLLRMPLNPHGVLGQTASKRPVDAAPVEGEDSDYEVDGLLGVNFAFTRYGVTWETGARADMMNAIAGTLF